MQSMRRVVPAMSRRAALSFFIFMALMFHGSAFAQDNEGLVKAAVLAKYHPTQATADHTDIVTAGDVITLQKSGMVMFPVTTMMHTLSYKDGKFQVGGFTGFAMVSGNATNGNQPRHFVSGEKVWLMDVEAKPDGLYLQFISDPLPDVRYMGTIKFPVDKKQAWPGPDEMMKRVSEVIAAAPGEPSQGQAAEASSPAAAPARAPAAAQAPTQSISLGQSMNDVVGAMGQPTQIIDLGAKKTYLYPGLKVIFVNGKVSDVQ
jgi:hypothetical protein